MRHAEWAGGLLPTRRQTAGNRAESDML